MTDPHKYYRIEAKELLEGLCQGTLDLEKGKGAADTVARLLRLAHTLKGASRVVKQAEIAQLAHQMEEVLAPYRDKTVPVPLQSTGELLRKIDSAEALLRALGSSAKPLPPEPAKAPEAPTRPSAPVRQEKTEEPIGSVRVDLPEIDAVVRSVSQAGSQLAGLRTAAVGIVRARRLAEAILDEFPPALASEGRAPAGRAAAEELAQELRHTHRLLVSNLEEAGSRLGHAQDDLHQLRLVPASVLFPSLDRAVRDAAIALQRPAQFHSSGGDHRLDPSVLGTLREALLHVVRNGVAHGIEPGPARAAAGKPAEGRIELRVERRGNRFAFVCSDDGGGIDLEAVREAAVRKGLLPRSAGGRLAVDEAVAILLRGGVSTAPSVTEVSGRGIGLDVLRDAIARMKGELVVRSAPGRGTTLEIVVPASLSSQAVLVVDAGGTAVSLPLDAVVKGVLLGTSDVSRSPEGESIQKDGRLLPLVSLSGILGRGGQGKRRPGGGAAVILRTGQKELALGVDRVLGVSRVIIRPLPAAARADALFHGASLDSDGNPQLVLNPAGLEEVARRPAAPTPGPAQAERRPVLVIDDSLTTRMMEQSILESAGYEVDLAISAEEALVKARERTYSLFICDVEMPGMNGFEFVAMARADASLKDVPSILVTSLGSPEDKSRGKRAGARAYVVKSEFDQRSFLEIVRGLVG